MKHMRLKYYRTFLKSPVVYSFEFSVFKKTRFLR